MEIETKRFYNHGSSFSKRKPTGRTQLLPADRSRKQTWLEKTEQIRSVRKPMLKHSQLLPQVYVEGQDGRKEHCRVSHQYALTLQPCCKISLHVCLSDKQAEDLKCLNALRLGPISLPVCCARSRETQASWQRPRSMPADYIDLINATAIKADIHTNYPSQTLSLEMFQFVCQWVCLLQARRQGHCSRTQTSWWSQEPQRNRSSPGQALANQF